MKKIYYFVLLSVLSIMAACGGGSAGSPSNPPNSGGGSSTPLQITTTSLPEGYTGQPYTSQIAATGGKAPLTYAIAPGSFFPWGLQLNSATGAITGSVDGGAVFGDVTFKVTDSGSPQQTALRTVRMTFHWGLSASTNPTIPAAAHLNAAYKLSFYANAGTDNVSWSLSAGQVPPGLTLTNANSRVADLVGTPTQTGTYNFTLQVVDNSSPPQKASISATIVVDNVLSITTATVATAYDKEPYSQTITAVNGTLPYHWTAKLPSFFSIDPATGTISGTAAMGNYGGDVTVTDSSSPAQTATQHYGWLILPRLRVNSGALGDARLNTSYTGTLSHSGGQGDLVWSVISGNVPPGLAVDSRWGMLTGIPTQMGSYAFSVQLTDSSTPPQVAQGQFTIEVKAPLLTLQDSLPRRIPVDQPFDGVAAASGGTLPITFTLNAGALPPGLVLDEATGHVSGTPTTAGIYSFTIKAVDSSNPQQLDTRTYFMTVDAALGRNDVLSKATPLYNTGYLASISPLIDPPDATTLSPDTDYYSISAVGGATIKVVVSTISGVLDPVLELLDANGARMHACRLPNVTADVFSSSCINMDNDGSSQPTAQLEYRVPGTADQKTTVYAHVLDWRGDARPDLTYSIVVSGAFSPIVFQTGPSLPDVAAKSSYYLNIYASGGTGSLTGQVTAGQLPPGITLNGFTTVNDGKGGTQWLGQLTGSPTTEGAYTFTIAVSDQAVPKQTVSQQFTIHVFPPIQLTPVADQVLTVGQKTTLQATATGGTPPYQWVVTGWNGVTVDKNTGLLTFQPTTAGQFTFDLMVMGTAPASGGTQWVHQVVNVTVK